MKMSQKRSFVGAIMLATGASEFYTQDVEEMENIVGDDQAKANTAKAVEGKVVDEEPEWMDSDEQREMKKSMKNCNCGSTGKFHRRDCPAFVPQKA